jgi:hypothetical protein
MEVSIYGRVSGVPVSGAFFLSAIRGFAGNPVPVLESSWALSSTDEATSPLADPKTSHASHQ